jgi:Enoyl-CoA hydratase/carnithine racemase
MKYETILFEKRERIAIITINRPEARNAINAQVWKEMGTALEHYAKDPDLWCAIITGAGDQAFCAGVDLKALGRGEKIVPEGGEHWGFAGIVKHYINKPIIAAVNGFALGGGTEIALACDLIIASEKATFGLLEVKRGIIAGAGGLLRLPRQIPLKIAMEKILTGNPITVEEATKWGMVNRVVPHDQLLEKAIELAKEITENAPIAVSASKDIVYRSLDVPLDHPQTAWAINDEYIQKVMKSEDSIEGVKAFAEKRKPQWKGR